MKNGLLIWNVLLSLVAGYLLIMHFSSGKGKKAGVKSSGSDTSISNGQFKIAYFEMDSIEAHFDMVKEVKDELAKKERSIADEIDRLTKNLQQKFNFYQNKAQSGALSEAESQAATEEMKKLDEQLKARKQQLDQEYGDLMMRKQGDMKKKIEDFLYEYNKGKNYTYIVSYDQSIFYYRDTAYNITVDVVKGLNELHKPKKN